MEDPTPSLKLNGMHRAQSRPDEPPAYQTQDAAPSICRICRGEGTPDEPLFYPCKCSGSIKYVHQDCLMEWLSHSQKKYCELCKTSFRFTKLYAPDMPQSLPVHVFVGHMAKYLLRNLLVWLRAAMAISVWVCWLPYFMRAVWSFMFWVSDQGLVSSSMLSRSNSTTYGEGDVFPSFGNATCPASPLFDRTTSAAVAETMLQELFTQTMTEFLIRYLLSAIGIPYSVGITTEAEMVLNGTSVSGRITKQAPPTLLGDVAFLQKLTRNPVVNRTLISVLEGQIITILVIVCFILVILVRDYVVQQQPEINMRAAFAAPNNAPPPPQEPILIRPEDVEGLAGPEDSDIETLEEAELPLPPTMPDAAAQPPPPTRPGAHEPPNGLGESATTEEAGASSSMSNQAPTNGDSNHSEERASVHDYLRIYRRADGSPEKILEIIEEEGLQEKLSFWMDVTRRSTQGQDFGSSDLASLVGRPEVSTHDRPGSSTSTADSSSKLILTPISNEGSTSGEAPSTSKGKEKEEESPTDAIRDAENERWAPGSMSTTSRPRAVSDGPLPQTTVNPLANNSWSFTGLPSDGESEDTPAQSRGLYDRPVFTEHIPQETGESSLFSSSEFEHPDDIHTETHQLADEEPALDDDQHDQQLQDIGNGGTQGQADRPRGFVDRVADFMWGELDDPAHLNDENHDIVGDGDEDGWVDMDDADLQVENGEVDLDAMPGAGLDPEAIDDLEDFEGVMELIGMRGPIAGLFQNAIFCAVLVSVTIFACIFIPYNIGRVSVWVLANPMRLVRLLFELSKLLQDAAVIAFGLASWVGLNLVDMFTSLAGGFIAAYVVSARKASWTLWTGASSRVLDYAFLDFPMSASEMQNFSAVSHEALLSVKTNVKFVFTTIHHGFSLLFGAHVLSQNESFEVVSAAAKSILANLQTACTILMNPSSWVIDLSDSSSTTVVDPSLAYWPGVDRFWAILAGYVTLFFIGAMYLKRGIPFSRGNILQAWEAGIIDTLHQASGIMKVIMIISIEMLVFPLYCGLLLDGALLPLFANTTFKSRMLFTYNYPLTSFFVHWFVGTGYMFHFALFVSMCRKIMRQGVLYFIRDPDDPEFHPVRDVLERNLTTQLRKILFSAFVYGALVIVCLGGVVWGLSYTLPNVLPIHYSSNEPVLEFPVDLLFYNFLMPLAVNFFKPGDGLHAMYTWWFRTCARGLRLTFFLFGERRIDEEGQLQLADTTANHELPWYKTLFLELDGKYRVIPKTWQDAFDGGHAKPRTPLAYHEMSSLRRKKTRLRENNLLIESGRFVRAPASDRVKIPKGKKVFLDVNERGERSDGQADTDLYASNQYQMVYIPPNFRARVFLFILFIWIFAAVTGVGFTIIPLIFGRRMFKMIIPEHIKTNDIYAFSIGVYLLGSFAYLIFHLSSAMATIQRWVASAQTAIAAGGAGKPVAEVAMRGVKLAYAYFFLLVVFPLLVSGLMELYLAIPLHTYMYPPTAASIQASRAGGPEASRHTVRVIQAWTLGLLYLKLGARMVTSMFADSRLAIAVRTVLRRGWAQPDTSLLTRAFVVPGLVVSIIAVFGPPTITNMLINYGVIAGVQPGVEEAAEAARLAIIYRQSYPAMALAALIIKNTIKLVKVFNGWTARIRDEAYLIGERLHNFGAAAAGARRVRGAWRAGGARL